MATTIFVGQLSYEATEEDVARVFKENHFQYEKITIPWDYEKGCIKGIAFVDMLSHDDVQQAIFELGNVSIKGRAVQMIEKSPDDGKGKGKGKGKGAFDRADDSEGRADRSRQRSRAERDQGSRRDREAEEEPAPRVVDNTPTNTIFVGQLAYEATEEDVARAFIDNNFAYSKITVPWDYEKGSTKGIAFVDMLSREDLEKALYEIGNVTIKGRAVQMIEKSPDKGKGKGKGFKGGKGREDRSRSPAGDRGWWPGSGRTGHHGMHHQQMHHQPMHHQQYRPGHVWNAW